MTSRDGRKSWMAELPVETIEEIREESKRTGLPQWKIANQSFRLALGLDEGSTEAAVKRQLEQKLDNISKMEDQMEDLQSDLETERERAEELRQKLEEIRESKLSHREKLDSILDDLVENQSKTVMAYMSKIRDAATDEYGRDTKDNISRVIEDLRRRRDERELTIADHRFTRTGAKVRSEATASADGGQRVPDLKWSKSGDSDDS